MLEFVVSFIMFCLVTFAITAGILYSELVSGIRDWWIERFKNSKLKYLGICSLCLGFHVANCIQWAYLGFTSILHYIGFSLAACGITWILTSIVNNMLWQKAFFEKIYYE